MSELFSQFVSLLTPKYSKIETNDPDSHPDSLLKNHFRATMTAEDRHKFFPEQLQTHPSSETRDTRSCSAAPPPPLPIAGIPTDNMCDVQLDDEMEDYDHVYDTIDEVREHKTSDVVNLVTEKSRLQLGDLFPSINEILNDHGIKEKLKDLTITVKNKLQVQKDGQAAENEEKEPKVSFLSTISLPKLPVLFGSDSERLFSGKQSKDKTVQTYFPGH